jgi:hypothetical protein
VELRALVTAFGAANALVLVDPRPSRPNGRRAPQASSSWCWVTVVWGKLNLRAQVAARVTVFCMGSTCQVSAREMIRAACCEFPHYSADCSLHWRMHSLQLTPGPAEAQMPALMPTFTSVCFDMDDCAWRRKNERWRRMRRSRAKRQQNTENDETKDSYNREVTVRAHGIGAQNLQHVNPSHAEQPGRSSLVEESDRPRLNQAQGRRSSQYTIYHGRRLTHRWYLRPC